MCVWGGWGEWGDPEQLTGAPEPLLWKGMTWGSRVQGDPNPGPRCWNDDSGKHGAWQKLTLFFHFCLPARTLVCLCLSVSVSPHVSFFPSRLSFPLFISLPWSSCHPCLCPACPHPPPRPCSPRTQTCPTRRLRGRPTSIWFPRTSSQFSSVLP